MNKPELFHEVNNQSVRDGINHLEEIKSTISWEKGEKILDVGCGPGTFTADILLKFAPEDATVVGCDISRKMIDFANSIFKAPRLSFIEMDIESSNIWDICSRESFSKIYSLYCVHWIENTRAAFENMYSLLKPGGELFLVFFADHKIIHTFIQLRRMEPWKNYIEGKNYFTMYATGTVEDRKKRITEELIQSGFEDVQIKVRDFTYEHQSLDHYLKVVRSVDPWHIFIPKNMEKEYEACIKKMVADNFAIGNDGKLTAGYKLFVVRSKKNEMNSL